MPLGEGEVFAGYTIVRLLGSGGMGEVYLAQHPRLPRHDALKILPANLTADVVFRQRFNREADLAARLWHPHIVGVHDRGEFEGQLWISMDYVEGTDAGRLLSSRYRTGMPQAEAFEIVAAVADGLDYAHSQGLLHRDVKPANILLGDIGPRGRRILLADFGIARQLGDISGLTATNMAVGTVAYSAPEQLMGLDLDGRADEYALGCTTFQLLTGSPLFQQSNPAVVISQHLSAPPPVIGERRPELAGLNAVIAKALAKEPDDRYPTCSDFAAALSAQPLTTTPWAAVTRRRPVTAEQEKASTHARPVTEQETAPSHAAAVTVPQQMTPTPPGRRLLRPATLIPAMVIIVLVVAAVVVGVQLWRGHSHNPGASSNAPTSTAQPSILLNRYITDRSGVLTPPSRAAVRGALDKLYADRKIHLWVAYVDNFGGLGPLRWAQNTVRDNAFTDTDALLAISTALRIYAFQVPPAMTAGTAINIADLRRNHIEPAVLAADWKGAAVAAANGLDVGVSHR
jgi:serine/threonine protein kinase, bacterial